MEEILYDIKIVYRGNRRVAYSFLTAKEVYGYMHVPLPEMVDVEEIHLTVASSVEDEP